MSELQSFNANNTTTIIGEIISFSAHDFTKPIKIIVLNNATDDKNILFLPCKHKNEYMQHYNYCNNGSHFILRHTNGVIDNYKCIDDKMNCLCTII